ncbi:MAG: hypothetical protein BWK73_19170 [Thiothrix lacustris]|uniref:Uncharacterized protein n=1 Tax=Thiothrix lacustris TaxID=525917 RepID=A0A1Y1QPP4_9GAMM|nr:MAG: hypothetical protein BWK73_19170 [Thiothrix lacustris]
MARTPKEGGLIALCQKHGITDHQLLAFVGDDIKSRTFWDWTKTKPIALECIIIGVAQQLKIKERNMLRLTDLKNGAEHYFDGGLSCDIYLDSILGFEKWKQENGYIYVFCSEALYKVEDAGDFPVLIA